MRNRKYQQLKTYSKIIKHKKNGQAIAQADMNHLNKQEEEEIQEEKGEIDMPKDEEFQDPVQDQFEEEEGWISESSEEENQKKEEVQSGTMQMEPRQPKEQQMMEEPQYEPGKKKQIYLGSNKHLAKGQVLQFDNHAYDMLHRLNVEWPSMSIDFVCKASPFDPPITQYQQMNKYPYQVLTVQGSCNNSAKNSIYFTKWAKLYQTKFDDDPDNQDQDDEDPQIIIQELETTYEVNRLRTLNHSPIVAFWNDDGVRGEIHIMDLTANLEKLNNNIGTKRRQKCKEIVIPCETSGWAINWNPHKIGELIAGDNRGGICVYANNENYTKWSKTSQYNYHKGPVQDIAFSPEQAFVFASCSTDGTLQLVDMRTNNYSKSQLRIKAHDRDVNVCDWNRIATHLIVTGSDDCKVKVWDLRMVTEGSSDELLCFNWHTEPITSIKFQPNQQSVIAVASQDNRLSIWDMAVQNQEQDPDVPNELMFLHQGQQEIKQISYHPIFFEMLISTSLDSINIFKPAFEMPPHEDEDNPDKQDLKRPPIREQDLDKYIERMSLD